MRVAPNGDKNDHYNKVAYKTESAHEAKITLKAQ